jgi:hypothetical protein
MTVGGIQLPMVPPSSFSHLGRRPGPHPAAANREVMVFDLITALLEGRDPIARGGKGEIVLVILIGPKSAALDAEGQVRRVLSRAASQR